MLEDKILLWKLKRGSADALRLLYEKYKNDLLALAIALSNDKNMAEDAMHDTFVSFAQIADKLQLRTNLKGYLLTTVANRVRNLKWAVSQNIALDEIDYAETKSQGPVMRAISAEQTERIGWALSELPYEQREVVLMHLQAGLKFNAMAKTLGVSINTVQSRYRYGLEKMRHLLNGQVEK